MKLREYIEKKLSLRLSLLVVGEVAVLLLLSLAVMFYFSRHVLKEESMRDAEQTLEGTVLQIDNILLSIEQSAGNFYWNLLAHLDQPDRMNDYCRHLVESNPYIEGCAIVFKPDYYPGHKLFMAYVHREGNSLITDTSNKLVTKETFAGRPYTEQVWYTEPMKTGQILWTDPLKNEDTEDEALISFCLPIFDQNMESIGVIATDLSIGLLSQMVLASMPSPNAYVTLLGRNGSFIVHPDSVKLTSQTVFSQMDQNASSTMKEAAEVMVAGETGQKTFRMNNQDWHVFYKPFIRNEVVGRSTGQLGWSVGIIYPDNDIFGTYNNLLYYVLGIALVGLLLFFVFCYFITHRQLKPLRKLTHSTQRIAQGYYDDELHVDASARLNEIGQLQSHFQRMQQSLAIHIGELENLSTTLQERSKVLRRAYEQAKEADRMKTTFLHFMTNQLTIPTVAIEKSITTICNNYHHISFQDLDYNVDMIQRESNVITDLLNRMLHTADNESVRSGQPSSTIVSQAKKEEDAHE